MLEQHHATLLRVARRWSLTGEDAEDAVQRALEIYVRRLDSVDPATELAWLKVVVRNEAVGVRRGRTGMHADAVDLVERLAAEDAPVDELVERRERVARSHEALARLKPDERTALLLKAEGFSYREIGRREGWTYTKVNRVITEGRRRFLATFAAIDAGEDCERHEPTLAALAAGEVATAADVLALRPHLRHCAACRATMRELHASRLRRLVLHVPFLAGVMPVRSLGDRVAGDAGTSGLRGLAHSALHRFTSPDAIAGAQLASGGGGRGTALAALLSLCVGGGAGTYCAVTGGLPDPVRLVGRAEQPDTPGKPPRRAAERAAATPMPKPVAPAPDPVPAHEPIATTSSPPPQTTKEPPPRRERRSRARRSDPAPEFAFESVAADPAAGSAPVAPTATTASSAPPARQRPVAASPPPTSGGEFLP
jgi:RNA polymerase sigma factor (sigma-70 family)